MRDETCIPNPEYLIKSIAEQGYSLETSVADLIDNAVSAGALGIEVLTDTQRTPFRVFIADNGSGMTPEQLRRNMNFPSSSIDERRGKDDLGRFGLGMKTASFSQTRRFTVISRAAGSYIYTARTWDVEHLKNTQGWNILINTDTEIEQLMLEYRSLSVGFLNPLTSFTPNTIVVWDGLYKYEAGLPAEQAQIVLQKELTENTREYLQLIFHRFMDGRTPLKIRLNNEQLKPFDPFPAGLRTVSVNHKTISGTHLRLDGFVLPNRSLQESKEASVWTLPHKSLMDMEGIYIYRGERLIVFGGWLGVIKKTPRLQLARLRVEIGNGADHLFHLNVAKSSIIIPFGERIAFLRQVSELKKEAEKEFYNYETKVSPLKNPVKNIFKKTPTSHGMSLEIDSEFALLRTFVDSLNESQRKSLRIILRLITTSVNKIRKVQADENYAVLIEKDNLREDSISEAIRILISDGVSPENILKKFIPSLGIRAESLPASILKLMKQ